MKTSLKKIVQSVSPLDLGIVFVFISLCFMAYYGYIHTKPRDGYDFKKNSSFTAVTDSMEPTLMVGDKYTISNEEDPKIGDIVVFGCLKGDCGLAGGGGASHRLTAISPTGCMTIIGDNPKYDWSQVPCYMPEDIRIVGVVHKL
jgi:hypothetical protein